jgi:hypothetical protein
LAGFGKATVCINIYIYAINATLVAIGNQQKLIYQKQSANPHVG